MALVNYERDGQIVTLTLNRPEKLNAFSDELVGVLGDALHRFDTDDEAQIAILCGNGRAFSSGADVQQRQLRSREEFLKLGGPQGRGTHSADLLTKAVNWKPVIAARARLCAGPLGRHRAGVRPDRRRGGHAVPDHRDLARPGRGQVLGADALSRRRRLHHGGGADRPLLHRRGGLQGQPDQSRGAQGQVSRGGARAGRARC